MPPVSFGDPESISIKNHPHEENATGAMRVLGDRPGMPVVVDAPRWRPWPRGGMECVRLAAPPSVPPIKRTLWRMGTTAVGSDRRS